MINTDLTGELSWLNERPLYVSMSGGKDSTALALYLQSQGVLFTPVFLDTGWEHELTYKYIKEELEPRFGQFIVLRNERFFKDDSDWKGGFEQAVIARKKFPSLPMRFCTWELKIEPMQSFYSKIRVKTRKKPINAVGIRADESLRRAKLAEIDEGDEATVWRPLLSWTTQQVIDIHKENKLSPNPLYLRGSDRVGCYPCIFAGKREIRYISITDPSRIDHMQHLEDAVNELRVDAGEEKATFFKSRDPKGAPMSVVEIAEWSKKRKQKKQYIDYDDIEDQEQSGCMNWGLCERSSYDDLADEFKLMDDTGKK